MFKTHSVTEQVWMLWRYGHGTDQIAEFLKISEGEAYSKLSLRPLRWKARAA